MNENVIFNQNPKTDDPNTPPMQQTQPAMDGGVPPEPPQPPPDQAPPNGGETPPPDEPPADGGEPPDEPPSDEEAIEEEEEYEETEPQTPLEKIKALLADSKVRKIIIGVVVFIFLLIIIIAIIPKGSNDKEVTITWWGLWESKATMQPIINEFQKENPNIKIEYTKQDPSNYRDTLLTRINNGSGPDILNFHNSWTPAITNILTPLPNDVISVSDFKKIYYPVMQKDLIKNGAIYGIPTGSDSLAMFVNIDILKSAGESVPKDWNQFIDTAKKLTVKDEETSKIKTSGAAIGTYGNIVHAPDIASVMFLQQGIDQINIDAEKDNLQAALTFYTSFATGKDKTWDGSLDNSQLAFAKGELAIYFGYSWDIFAIEQLKGNNKLNYEVHPMPSLAGGKSITVASYWAEGVSVKSKNQKEALLFIKYLTEKKTLQKIYTESSKTRAFGKPYPRIDMAQDLKENAIVYPFITQMENAGSSFFSSNTRDGSTGINTRVNSYLENTINSIVNDRSAPESEVPILQTGVKQVLQENGIQ